MIRIHSEVREHVESVWDAHIADTFIELYTQLLHTHWKIAVKCARACRCIPVKFSLIIYKYRAHRTIAMHTQH